MIPRLRSAPAILGFRPVRIEREHQSPRVMRELVRRRRRSRATMLIGQVCSAGHGGEDLVDRVPHLPVDPVPGPLDRPDRGEQPRHREVSIPKGPSQRLEPGGRVLPGREQQVAPHRVRSVQVPAGRADIHPQSPPEQLGRVRAAGPRADPRGSGTQIPLGCASSDRRDPRVHQSLHAAAGLQDPDRLRIIDPLELPHDLVGRAHAPQQVLDLLQNLTRRGCHTPMKPRTTDIPTPDQAQELLLWRTLLDPLLCRTKSVGSPGPGAVHHGCSAGPCARNAAPGILLSRRAFAHGVGRSVELVGVPA